MKSIFTLSIVLAATLPLAAHAGDLSGGSLEASAAASTALVMSGTVVAGSALIAGSAVVVSVAVIGESTVIVLKSASDAGVASIRLTGQAARELSVVAGTTVSIVACSTGYSLIAAGKMIAFIPNQVGLALVHTSRVAGN